MLADEFDEIREAARADLGAADRAYFTHGSLSYSVCWRSAAELCWSAHVSDPRSLLGPAILSLAKVLENMEIGHNVLHGQWDWMQDLAIHSSTWEWDAASTAASRKCSHNFQHHTYTNVLGRDRDLGYSAMRVEPGQRWHPIYLTQPIYFFLIAAIFERGITVYDLELDAVCRGEKPRATAKR